MRADWQAAQRAQFETKLLAMRFGLDTPEMDVLPMSPLDAMTTAFWEEMDKHDSLLPQRRTAGRHRTGVGLTRSADRETDGRGCRARGVLRQGHETQCGPVGPVREAAGRWRWYHPGPRSHCGTCPLPAGAYQDALGPTTGPTVPETLAERTHREEEQRALAWSRADLAREMGEDAQRLKAGPPKGSGPMQGLRA